MCDTCGKAFSNKSTLNRHRLLHQESAHQIKINILTCPRAQKHAVGTLTGPKCRIQKTEHSKVSLPSMILSTFIALFSSIKSLRSTLASNKPIVKLVNVKALRLCGVISVEKFFLMITVHVFVVFVTKTGLGP